jgi:hypothetical protein
MNRTHVHPEPDELSRSAAVMFANIRRPHRSAPPAPAAGASPPAAGAAPPMGARDEGGPAPRSFADLLVDAVYGGESTSDRRSIGRWHRVDGNTITGT